MIGFIRRGTRVLVPQAGIMIFLTLCSEIAGSPAISEISPAILEKFIMRFYVNTLMSIPPES